MSEAGDADGSGPKTSVQIAGTSRAAMVRMEMGLPADERAATRAIRRTAGAHPATWYVAPALGAPAIALVLEAIGAPIAWDLFTGPVMFWAGMMWVGALQLTKPWDLIASRRARRAGVPRPPPGQPDHEQRKAIARALAPKGADGGDAQAASPTQAPPTVARSAGQNG